MATFPKFTAHSQAECFKCEGTLSQPSDDGHAPGRGQFKAHCAECGTFTWYDIRARRS